MRAGVMLLDADCHSLEDWGEISDTRLRPLPNLPHYFCPVCGEEWAFFYPMDSDYHRHQAYHARCPRHGGGSLKLWGDFPLIHLNHMLLAREIGLILTYGDRYDFANYSDDPNASGQRAEAWKQYLADRGNWDWQDIQSTNVS